MNSDMLVRITRYYRALNRLRAIGLEKVFAHNLADAAGVSAAVVRKDFSILAIHGQKRGGYEITDLIDRISGILGKGEPQNVIVVGCGRIGKALMHYSGFEPDGIRIAAGFVYPISRLDEMVDALDAKVAIITVPESAAADTAKKLMEAGIKGILNFSPITLKPHPAASGDTPVIIHNINIALELEQIFYQIQFPSDKKQKDTEE